MVVLIIFFAMGLLILVYSYRLASEYKQEKARENKMLIEAIKRVHAKESSYLGRASDNRGAYFYSIGMLWICNSCKREVVSTIMENNQCSCGGVMSNT